MSPLNNFSRSPEEEMERDGLPRGYCYECESSPCKCEELKKVRQEELEAYIPDFEQFLMEVFAKEVGGTEGAPLDDETPDAFDNWYGMQDADTMAKYSEEYGKACFRAGQKVGM